jgi:hypothetical protein
MCVGFISLDKRWRSYLWVIPVPLFVVIIHLFQYSCWFSHKQSMMILLLFHKARVLSIKFYNCYYCYNCYYWCNINCCNSSLLLWWLHWWYAVLIMKWDILVMWVVLLLPCLYLCDLRIAKSVFQHSAWVYLGVNRDSSQYCCFLCIHFLLSRLIYIYNSCILIATLSHSHKPFSFVSNIFFIY